MLSLETIEKDILELESRDTSFAVCQRLAVLYTVRDHLRGYSTSPEETMALAASSDFLQAVNGKPAAVVMEIMDDVMTALQSLHPKMYDTIMEQISKA